jgi:hypothetical protein
VFAQVFRAYDSRFRPTQRRPDVYGDPDIAPGAKVVCRVVDKNIAGKLPPRDEWLAFQLWDRRRARLDDPWKTRWWLWQFGGELLVIQTYFHKGRHYALSPMDFGPVVQFLQTMHENGYVHGDVRCANIVFNKCLIDFDLGGRLDDAPTYPDGYKRTLDDGTRLGREREPITKWHDWYAMLNVMFEIHRFDPPAANEDCAPGLSGSHRRFASLASKVSPDGTEIQNLPDELIAFLKDAESWTVTLSGKFLLGLEDWGVVPARQAAPREASPPATGSPQEQKR